MIIGIDISQIVYEGTGVSRYVKRLVAEILRKDQSAHYVLFGSSFRKRNVLSEFADEMSGLNPRVRSVILPLPLKVLDILWNILHVFPIEMFTGRLDVFWSSDWTQPPLSEAKGITTIHDLSIFRFPESFDNTIMTVHKRKLNRSKKICSVFLCDSEATMKDAMEILRIPATQLQVVYPGI